MTVKSERELITVKSVIHMCVFMTVKSERELITVKSVIYVCFYDCQK